MMDNTTENVTYLSLPWGKWFSSIFALLSSLVLKSMKPRWWGIMCSWIQTSCWGMKSHSLFVCVCVCVCVCGWIAAEAGKPFGAFRSEWHHLL